MADSRQEIDEVQAEIGGRLKRAMKGKVVQRELSQDTGIPQGNISHFLNASKGLDARNLLRLLVSAGNRGIDIHRVITGRSYVDVFSDGSARFAEQLRTLADSLTTGERGAHLDGGPGERPRAPRKRRKA